MSHFQPPLLQSPPLLVSVIIPAFNQEALLPQCLRSVLSQPLQPLEVLVVDDGSTDGTAHVAEAFARQDARVRLVRQANQGAGAARNLGLRRATGQYVHFLDADDWLVPDAYAHWQAAVARHPQAELVFANFQQVDTQSGQVRPVNAYALEPEACRTGDFEQLQEWLLKGPVMPWSRWCARAFIQSLGAEFDAIGFANDRAFHFRTVTHTKQVVMLGAALVNHRVKNPGSLAGRAGPERLDATFQAFQGITQAAGHLSLDQQKVVFSQNMADVLGLLARTAPVHKTRMAQTLSSQVAAAWMPFSPDALAQEPWYAAYQVAQAVAALSELRGTSVNLVPVVFAVNDAYVPYLNVVLQSISDTLDSGWTCVAFVLNLGLTTDKVRWLEEELCLPNVPVFCIHMAGLVGDLHLHTLAHYTPEIYLRLWIPELLSAFPKVIYLDTDVVVCKSLHALYESDVSNVEVAGVLDFNNAGHKAYVETMLGVSATQYVNSGVLLFNTVSCLVNSFRQRCFQVLEKHAKLNCPDQDMINIACQGRIGLLDPGWNYLWNYGFSGNRQPPDGPAWFAEEFKDAKLKKFIVHFSSAIKPWDHVNDLDADIFWNVARRCDSYVEIIRKSRLKKAARIYEILTAY